MEMQSSKFARDMMAQKLMSENKDNPFNSRFFQPSDAMVAPTRQRFSNLLSRMEQKDKQGTDVFPALAIGSGFAPSAGISDVLGFAPDPFNKGQTLPSFSENIDQGRFLDAGLQTLGAGGDVLLAAAPFAPYLFLPAAGMKLTSQLGKALRGGSRATKTVDDVKTLDDIKKKYPNVDLDVYDTKKGLTLSKIVVPEGARSEGIGSNVMKDLIKYADENNLPIALTPDSSFGGSKTRLKSFYRKFGFKDNKGRNKDFSFRESMIRQPQNKPGDIAKVVPPTDKSDGIFAFHGSAADFDEFKLSKIGTGEGAQAFGYGLYFTDSEDIAKFYKNAMSRSVDIDGKPYIRGNNINDKLVDQDIADDLGATNGDLEAAIKSSEDFLKEMIAADNVNAIRSTSKELEKLKKLRGRITINEKPGKTYKVNIKAVMDDLIDYDKSLRQQNDKVKKILKPYYEYYSVAETADFGTLLESTYRHLPQDEFSERLAKEGIKGIKYKAGQLSGVTDSKATNYVIFDDKIIDIMAKYGIVGAIGVSAMQRGSGSTKGDILPPGET